MATSFGALCTDFYVNHKLTLQMELPADRETILHMFDSVRRAVPSMSRFRRFDGELALESSRREAEYRWLALQPNNVRAGHVNPETMESAYAYHRMMLKLTPVHLSISPLDVDCLELIFGFDLECRSNHDEVVFEALYSRSPLGGLGQLPGGAKAMDVQPVFGFNLDAKGERQAYFDVKTRSRSRRGKSRYRDEPISLFLTLRRNGNVERIEDLQDILTDLTQQGEALVSDRLIPDLLTPIARQITNSSA
jgi:hypothetical protein